MKKAVVTGAGGFIGHALVEELIERNVFVYAIVHHKMSFPQEHTNLVQVIELDMHEYKYLHKRIDDEKIDYFFHLAWSGVSGKQASDLEIQQNNALYTLEALQMAMNEMKVQQFIFAGSSYEYRTEPIVCNGKNVNGNISIYGAAKHACRILCESYAAKNNFPFKSFSFTNVFGIGDNSNRSTNTLIRQFQAGSSPALIEGNHYHDWIYIDDAVQGILAVAEKGIPLKEYYIGSRKLRTFREIVCDVKDCIAPEIPLRFGEYIDNAYINYDKIDTEALFMDTGFQCQCNFIESIRKTAEWLKLCT